MKGVYCAGEVIEHCFLPVEAFQVGLRPSKHNAGAVRLHRMLCKPFPLQALSGERPVQALAQS